MKWTIKHKSGRVLFVTSDEFIADNRRKMEWIVEEVKMTSREQFEEWVTKETGFDLWRTEFPMTEWDDQQYKCHQTNLAWMAWQASRAAVEIELPDIEDKKWHSSWHGKFRAEAFWLETRRVLNGYGLKVKK